MNVLRIFCFLLWEKTVRADFCTPRACYWTSSDIWWQRSWDVSEVYCLGRGQHLARFYTLAEYQPVYDWLKGLGLPVHWFDLNSMETALVFKYTDDTTLGAWDAWYPTDPNAGVSAAVVLDPQDVMLDSWKDRTHTNNYYFLCQEFLPVTTLGLTTIVTTELPTTPDPTTLKTSVAITTLGVTSVAPTTDAITTIAPTTDAVTTIAPTTDAVTTIAPTTDSATTIPPTTDAVTTIPPTTDAVTTIPPTTDAVTTIPPTTDAETTIAPTTDAGTTIAPTTDATTSMAPTTVATTSMAPTTVATTNIPWTSEATSGRDSTSVVMTTQPNTTSVTSGFASSFTSTRNTTNAMTPGQTAHNETTEPLPLTTVAYPDNWTEWTTCSATCHNGLRVRHKLCDVRYDPGCYNASSQRINDRLAFDSQVELCEAKECTPDWSLWQPWSECSATCGIGTQQRWRRKLNAAASECSLQHWQSAYCNAAEVCVMRVSRPPAVETSPFTEADRRPSAKAVGGLGIGIMAGAGALLLVLDLCSIGRRVESLQLGRRRRIGFSKTH